MIKVVNRSVKNICNQTFRLECLLFSILSFPTSWHLFPGNISLPADFAAPREVLHLFFQLFVNSGVCDCRTIFYKEKLPGRLLRKFMVRLNTALRLCFVFWKDLLSYPTAKFRYTELHLQLEVYKQSELIIKRISILMEDLDNLEWRKLHSQYLPNYII